MSTRLAVTFLRPGQVVRVRAWPNSPPESPWSPCRSGVKRDTTTATVLSNVRALPARGTRVVRLRLSSGEEVTSVMSATAKIEVLPDPDLTA